VDSNPTILGYEGESGWHYFRQGGVALEEIETITGPLLPAVKGKQNPQSSGMLNSHYAPHTPLIMGELPILIAQHSDKRLGAIVFQESPGQSVEKIAILSPEGDLMEAARNLFSVMHEMDQAGLDLILAEPVPARGLGLAINDRLQRAEAERKSD
ncbi:MAG: Sua5 family C-terminal domain-containing protein, partial [Bacteroidota bacterium]